MKNLAGESLKLYGLTRVRLHHISNPISAIKLLFLAIGLMLAVIACGDVTTQEPTPTFEPTVTSKLTNMLSPETILTSTSVLTEQIDGGMPPITITEKMYRNSIVELGDASRINQVYQRAEKGAEITVGFLGGSITGNAGASSPEYGYPNLVLEWLKKKFPKATFKLINAGIGGTSSDLGIVRLKNDLLSFKPDIIFIEFAVNDYGLYKTHPEYRGYFEAIVRKTLKAEKQPAVILFFTLDEFGSNEQDEQIKIGSHYHLPMISAKDALWPELTKGKISWSAISAGTVHPHDNGHRIYADLIINMLDKLYRHCLPNCQVSDQINTPFYTDIYEDVYMVTPQNPGPVKISNLNWVVKQEVSAIIPYNAWSNSKPTELNSLDFTEIKAERILMYGYFQPAYHGIGVLNITLDQNQFNLVFTGNPVVSLYFWLGQGLDQSKHRLKIVNTEIKVITGNRKPEQPAEETRFVLLGLGIFPQPQSKN